MSTKAKVRTAVALTALNLCISGVAIWAGVKEPQRTTLRYLPCSEQASDLVSRCPPEGEQVVLARTLTAWTVARYSPTVGWVTPSGDAIRGRVVTWVDLPDAELMQIGEVR